MKYIINYTNKGKILGFAKGDTALNIEVSNAIWFEAQSYNKIIIDKDKNISFDKVDWRTQKEIEEARISKIKAKANELITSRYSIVWQLNHPRTLPEYSEQYQYIDRIREISNISEADGTKIEDINWEA